MASITGVCQNCTEEFDWRESSCPECGWDKQGWVAGGRFGPMAEARP